MHTEHNCNEKAKGRQNQAHESEQNFMPPADTAALFFSQLLPLPSFLPRVPAALLTNIAVIDNRIAFSGLLRDFSHRTDSKVCGYAMRFTVNHTHESHLTLN